MHFTKATRKKAKLRLALTGTSGSGKTFSALRLATGLGGRIAVIDTEHDSASLYANQFEFDTLRLDPPYNPERFISSIDAAEAAGYDVLVIDSITHEWQGTGGVLDLVDVVAKAKFKGNSWAAWNELTPRHRKFLDTILQSNLHIIATMRSKAETAQQDVNGTKKVVKLGTKTEQREGTDYEFTTVLDLSHDGHFASASKDRTGLFKNSDPAMISEDTGRMLMTWLNEGEDAPATIDAQQREQLQDLLAQAGIEVFVFCDKIKINSLRDLAQERFDGAVKWIGDAIARSTPTATKNETMPEVA